MNDVFLGVIAIAVSVIAIVQVATLVFATRAARRVGDAVGRVEQDVRPIIANLQSMSADAARVTATAAAGVERADRAVADFFARMNDVVAAVREAVVRPARDGMAWLQLFKSAMDGFRTGSSGGRRARPHTDDDEGMFIG